jgi:hypothetical protein
MMEEKTPMKKPEDSTPKDQGSDQGVGGKKGGKSCLKILFAAIAILFFLFLLLAGAVAVGIAATGLIEVPVISNLIKPPAVTEDFSYKKVSEKKLSQKLGSSLSGTEGNVKATVTLTDDEVNTLIGGLTEVPDSPVKSILVKFRPGVIKISGTLSQNDASFYGELKIAKSTDTFEFEFQNVRLGALPLPGSLIEGLISQVLGTGQLLGPLTAESFPVKGITVKDGLIVIKGLDLSGLGPPGE